MHTEPDSRRGWTPGPAAAPLGARRCESLPEPGSQA